MVKVSLMAAQIVIRLFLLAGVCALFAGSIVGLVMLNRPKPGHFIIWLRSFGRWRTVADLGAWRYQENTVTGQRRALRIYTGYSALDSAWLNGGRASLFDARHLTPPRGGSAVRPC